MTCYCSPPVSRACSCWWATDVNFGNYTWKASKETMKWNASVLGHFFCTIKAELGRGQPGLIRWNFLWNLSQSSIDLSTLDSESSALLLDHGGPAKKTIGNRMTNASQNLNRLVHPADSVCNTIVYLFECNICIVAISSADRPTATVRSLRFKSMTVNHQCDSYNNSIKIGVRITRVEVKIIFLSSSAMSFSQLSNITIYPFVLSFLFLQHNFTSFRGTITT